MLSNAAEDSPFDPVLKSLCVQVEGFKSFKMFIANQVEAFASLEADAVAQKVFLSVAGASARRNDSDLIAAVNQIDRL